MKKGCYCAFVSTSWDKRLIRSPAAPLIADADIMGLIALKASCSSTEIRAVWRANLLMAYLLWEKRKKEKRKDLYFAYKLTDLGRWSCLLDTSHSHVSCLFHWQHEWVLWIVYVLKRCFRAACFPREWCCLVTWHAIFNIFQVWNLFHISIREISHRKDSECIIQGDWTNISYLKLPSEP